MGESEIDEYKLDTNQGKKKQTLRVSLINNRINMVITIWIIQIKHLVL